MKLGIDLGATNTRLVLLDEKNNLIKFRKHKTIIPKNANISNFVINIVKSFCNIDELEHIGIAVPGPITKEGVIYNAPNFPVKHIPIKKPLEKFFKKKVTVLNDAVAAAIGEYFTGFKEKIKNLVYITISTGIGGGVIINGKILPGNAHEIGHIVVDFKSPFICHCGGRGHWEAISSGRSISNVVKYFLNKEISTREFFREVSKDDSKFKKVFNYISMANSAGVATVANIYDPDIIVFGGGVCLNNWSIIREGIFRFADNYKFLDIPKLELARLGDLSGAIGAAICTDEYISSL